MTRIPRKSTKRRPKRKRKPPPKRRPSKKSLARRRLNARRAKLKPQPRKRLLWKLPKRPKKVPKRIRLNLLAKTLQLLRMPQLPRTPQLPRSLLLPKNLKRQRPRTLARLRKQPRTLRNQVKIQPKRPLLVVMIIAVPS